MYRIHLTNFGYFLDKEHNSLDEAKSAAVKAGFESTIILNGDIVLSWSPIGGFRKVW